MYTNNLLNIIHSLYEKIKTLQIILFEQEQEIKKLKHTIQVHEDTIQTLNMDIYFSDMELKDIQQIMELSQDVMYMHSLQEKNSSLKKNNNVLSRLVNKEILLC
jgi:cell division protein FtsB